MTEAPNQEVTAILSLLDQIEKLASRPDRGSKRKLLKCGQAAHGIRVLLFTGARKAIEAEQGIDFTPENGPAKKGPHLVRYDDD